MKLWHIAPLINTSLWALVCVKSNPCSPVTTLIPPINLLLNKILTHIILLHLVPAERSGCFPPSMIWVFVSARWITFAFPFSHYNFLAAGGAVAGKQFHLANQSAVENSISAFKSWKSLPLNGIWLGTRYLNDTLTSCLFSGPPNFIQQLCFGNFWI